MSGVLVNLFPLLSCAPATWAFFMLWENVILPISKVESPFFRISSAWLKTSHNSFEEHFSHPLTTKSSLLTTLPSPLLHSTQSASQLHLQWFTLRPRQWCRKGRNCALFWLSLIPQDWTPRAMPGPFKKFKTCVEKMNRSSEEDWETLALNPVSTSLQHLTIFCPTCLLTFNFSFPCVIFSYVVYSAERSTASTRQVHRRWSMLGKWHGLGESVKCPELEQGEGWTLPWRQLWTEIRIDFLP